MVKVRDKKLISTYGQRVLDAGFYSIPNLILDYQNELNLTDEELVFYIKVTHFYSKTRIELEKLKMSHKRSSLFKIRKSLFKKGYLELIRLEESKVTIYNWGGLIEALNNIVQNLDSPEIGQLSPESGQISPESGFSSIIEKNIVKEQQQKKDVVVLVNRMTKIGMSEDVIKDLINSFDIKRIEEKVSYCERTWKKWKVNNPAGWLRKAIEDDWKIPENEKDKSDLIAKAKKRYELIKKSLERKV